MDGLGAAGLHSAGTLRTVLLRALAVALVYLELLCQAAASSLLAALPSACTGRARAHAVARARAYLAPLPSLLAYALAPPDSPRAKRALAPHATALAQLSLLYRLLVFVIVV